MSASIDHLVTRVLGPQDRWATAPLYQLDHNAKGREVQLLGQGSLRIRRE